MMQIYENPWISCRESEKMRDAQREIWKAAAKTEAVEQTRLNYAAAKVRIKEEEAERKKRIYEQIEIDKEGNITVVTKNLAFLPQKRRLCNMKAPVLQKLIRLKEQDESAYFLTCVIGNTLTEIFFADAQIGDAAYVLRKIRGAGGMFYGETQATCKKYAIELVTGLLPNAKSVLVPDAPGWMRLSTGEFIFVEEGDLTWKNVKKKIR